MVERENRKMCQKLYIGFSCHGNEICGAYFHWGGYTKISADALNSISRHYAARLEKGDTEKKAIINALYGVGAGISEGSTPEELKTLSPELKYLKSTDICKGAIALNPNEQKAFHKKADADAFVFLDNKEFQIGRMNICLGTSLAEKRKTKKNLQAFSEHLAMSEADVVKLIDAHREYIKNPGKAEALCLECSNLLPTREHGSEILCPNGILVKDGRVVDSVRGMLIELEPRRIYALDEGLVYEPFR